MPQAKKPRPKKPAPKKRSASKKPAKSPIAKMTPAKSAKTSKTTQVPKTKAKRPSAPKKTGAAKKPVQLQEQAKPSALFKRIILARTFGQLFAIGSVVLLFLTIVFWAFLSARLQQMNADQLSDSYLFRTGATFKGAGFPSAHTFLLKWPLFYVIKLLGNTPFVFALASVAFVLATISVLVFILYRIERRPLVFGCLCLALTSVLLMIPAQPYPGALLPVNMAMLTTRNLEYAVYIVAIYCMLRAARLRSSLFAIGAVLMLLLAASDTLFATLGLVGAALALCVQRFFQWRKADARPFLRWIFGTIIGAILAAILLAVLNHYHVTHIVKEGNSVSPYGIVHSPKQFFEAVVFAIGAFLTNLGANPLHGLVILKDGPSALADSLTQLSIIPYMVNFALAGFGLWAVYRVLRTGMYDTWTRLSLALFWSSVTAFAIFVATDHYYPVDTRYVSIVMFTLFITTAVYVRGRQFTPRHLYIVAIVLLCAIPFGMNTAFHEYHQSRAALSTQDALSHRVANILKKDNITHLMGDYWTVLPIKAYSGKDFTVLPVKPCSQPQTVLASTAYFLLKHNQPVAFLATRDGNSNTFVGCTLQEIHTLYGDTTTSRVVSGTKEHPEAILYTYDKGFGHISKHDNPIIRFVPTPASAAQPIAALSAAKCAGKTIINVVAHEDDDLLFMNPDMLDDIHSGKCIVTIYLTAGDAGNGQPYWVGRQVGEQSAYSFMYAEPNVWNEEYSTLNGHIVTTDRLAGNNTMELIFLNLPDGGLNGNGFKGSKPDSMNGLRQNQVSSLTTDDGLATYDQPGIISTLTTLYNLESPTEIHTQNYSNKLNDGDHSDHHAAGFFAQQAFNNYEGTATIKAYAGYPDRAWPVNVTGGNETEKLLTFLVYAAHDPAVCQTLEICRNSTTYGSYLTRQYSRVVATHQAAPAGH